MNDSIELPALAMSIDEEVKAEAVDQTMVSVELQVERFCSSASPESCHCHLPPMIKIFQ